VTEVSSWLFQHGMLLNPAKSEAMLIGSAAQRTAESAQTASVSVAGSLVPLSSNITIIGITFDTAMIFNQHVGNVCRSCNFQIRAL